MLTLVARVDRPVLFVNLVLLLTVSVIPFPTRLLAEYLLEPGATVAAAIYSVTMLVMGMAFGGLWMIIARRPGLLHHPLDQITRRTTMRRFAAGQVFYAGAVGLSFVSAVAALALHGLLAVYYCFDQLTPGSADVDDVSRP